MITVTILALLVAAVAIFLATRPCDFRIERSAQIEAPAARVFGLIDDFHEWVRWSPWEKLDPHMKKTFAGPSAGPGSVYTWNGNSKAGEGRMTLLASTPGELVAIELEFIRPFAATNHVKFHLTRNGSGTLVVWSMDGTHTLMSKAFWPFMSKMVGKDFEEGLQNLNKAVATRR
jgi:hypothetical protein